MTGQQSRPPLTEIQTACDRLVSARAAERPRALEELSHAILDYFSHSYDSPATPVLFSRELPPNIQRFAAAWLVWTLMASRDALRFDNTEGMAGSLFDRTLQHDVYKAANIEPGTQTFEKLPGLTARLQSVLNEIDQLIGAPPDLGQLRGFRQELMRLLNREANRGLLVPLVPRSLIQKSRINGLFDSVEHYLENKDVDPIHTLKDACEACDEFENEARSFGTAVANDLLGGLARRLRSAVERHFNSLEASRKPNLSFSPIAKKYPLDRPCTAIVFKIGITNNGTGPARELRLDEVVADDCLHVETSRTELGTLQSGSSFVLDIVATVMTPSTEAKLLVQLSWLRPDGRSEAMQEFTVAAQRDDVDWDLVEFTEPYSLEAVTTGDELIGRKDELKRLVRLTNLAAVGSGFIYGHKRVGKTSLANAVAENLKSGKDANWVVISKGSGDYVGGDASSTLRTLGDVLAQAMIENIPGLANVPYPDFTNGLAPLSGFVDRALADRDLRLLFILDEFDELPPALFRRTDLSTSLFQPLRQISNKRGCGFLLVGGENMQPIVNLQGDRLNKFRPIEVDSFDRSNNWSDFVELVRRPVENWLTISDAALEELFASSAGNPYFAKLLASELFAYMVENRYSDASEIDVATAIDKTLRTIGANSFAHFWTDGLVEGPEEIEQQRMIRRSVLIVAGRAFRKHSSVDAETMWADFGRPFDLPIWEQRFRATLQDFVVRKVLVEDEQGMITPKIPLFRSWLKDRGVGELLESSRELDDLRSRLKDEESIRVKDDELAELCETWKRFRFRGQTIESTAIRSWLDQFDSLRDQRLMFRLLSGLGLYDEHTVRMKMHEAFGIVTRNMRIVIEAGSRVRRDILVSSLDNSAAKAGLTYCRLFASENQISAEAVSPLASLERRFADQDERVQRLVLVDDFSGTGQTLVNGLKENLDLLRLANSNGIGIVVIAVAGFTQARGQVERFIRESGLEADVYFCDELGPEDKAFSEESRVFPDPDERDRARQAAEGKGIALEKRQPLGYGDTQSVIVFYQGCPNNTLPILWSGNSGWSALFPRM